MDLSLIVVASTNRHKYEELVKLFSKTNISLLFGGDIEEGYVVDETEDTYEKNALLKARAWAQQTGMPAIADDSGIEILALDGAPGVLSARAAPGNDEDRVRWLLDKMEGAADRSARFVACIVLALPNEEVYYAATGMCTGTIALSPSGSAGFGYDPVFIPDGYTETLADLGEAVKSKKSHRAIAARKMAQIISSML